MRLELKVELGAKVEDEITQLAKNIRTAVAIRNPKRTGRSAASWNLSIGQPNDAKKGRDYDNVPGSIFDGEVDVEGFKLGQELHISNDQPYIRRLNAGSSAQAPAGFVEATVEAFKDGTIR